MHWIALHFPELRQQALSRGHASPDPGREALEAVAAWACQYTPRVSLEPPQDLLLEVEGSLRHFGGHRRLRARMRRGVAALGFDARLGEAPTVRAALWLARGDGRRLEALPVAVLGLSEEADALLSGLGIRTLGALMRLPREGLARRFGQRLAGQLDCAAGLAPEPREYFAPPAAFAARLELPAPVAQAEQALFAVRRLLVQMEGFLAARQAGVRGFSLGLVHRHPPATRLRIGLAGTGRDAAHFARLAREALAKIALASPVEAIELVAQDLEALAGASGDLFRGAVPGGEDWLRLVERLQARLGREAVHGLETGEDFRPERASCRPAPGTGRAPEAAPGAGTQPFAPRPLWLLEAPRALREGDVTLLAGPERIETGWWDGAEARRDYFIARTAGGALAWVYRERDPGRGGGWFLHGWFA